VVFLVRYFHGKDGRIVQNAAGFAGLDGLFVSAVDARVLGIAVEEEL
jgi:hypothetical protein